MLLQTLIASVIFALSTTTKALSLDPSDTNSIKTAAKTVAEGLLASYNGNQPGETPGLYPAPYYWWSAGAVWSAMVDYWDLTGDNSYNEIVEQALAWQVGPDFNYMPPNETKVLGNDDQATWANAALTAAERSFPSASTLNQTSYLSIAKAVFDTQVARWDQKTCGGGLRWQIFTFNDGYSYKNSASNGNLFKLAARLARYTGNKTYSDWTEKVYSWEQSVGLLNDEGAVFDGTDTTVNCSQINHIQWSSDSGYFLYGSALMYNITNGSELWKNRTSTILSHATNSFFSSDVLTESACEAGGECDIDQFFFKGIMANDLARTAQIAPFTASTILPLLQNSAKAAASIGCIGSGEDCVSSWTTETTESNSTVGSQFSALQVIQANLVPGSKAPAIGTATNNSSSVTPSNASGTSTSTSKTSTPSAGSAGRTYNSGSKAVACLLLVASVATFL